MQLPEDSPLRPSLKTIEKSGSHAALIVQDMLTLAKSGLHAEEVVNLADIVDEYINDPKCLNLKDTHPGVLLTIRIDEDVANIKGSRVHLLKMLMNLVSNGADAIDEEREVQILLQNKFFDSHDEIFKEIPVGQYVYLTIHDSGSGISAENLKKVFDPFYSAKKIGRKGTGLGMVIVRNTVMDHHGAINIESEEGKGTTAHIVFPVTDEKIPTKVAGIESGFFIGNGESILVVDDTESQLDIARAILESLHYSVTTVNSGIEATELFARRHFDLVLLDMMMEPGISGLETTKRILSQFPEARIIIASGYSQSGMVHEAIKLGAKRFIQKPYSVKRLSTEIQEVLDKNPK